MIVNPLVGAEQCNVTRLDIVDFTTLMEPGTWDLGPTKKDRNSYPGLPHYPGETVVCLRKVMVQCVHFAVMLFAYAVLKAKLFLQHHY